MTHTVELNLTKTIFAGGRFIRKLELRPPTQVDVDEACGLFDDAGERGLYLMAKLCGVSPRVLTKLAPEDLGRLQILHDALAEA